MHFDFLQVADVLKFCLILLVVIVSFGIAFQSILSGKEQISWRQLTDILWRPFWQMFGEIFVEDDGMGTSNISLYALHCLKILERWR